MSSGKTIELSDFVANTVQSSSFVLVCVVLLLGVKILVNGVDGIETACWADTSSVNVPTLVATKTRI